MGADKFPLDNKGASGTRAMHLTSSPITEDIYAPAASFTKRMYKTLTQIYAVALVLGMVAVAMLAVMLASHGYTAHVQRLFPQETAMLVRVIGKSAHLLCLITAGISAWYAAKQLFVAPSHAMRQFLKAATVLSMGFAVPLVFGMLAENALGANPFL
jgi:hypothetical protein